MHLNDIALRGADILCSCFGPRLPNAMRDAHIFEAGQGGIFAAHLREPHGITTQGDDVFVLESTTGDLLRIRHGFAPQRVCAIHGYARGLAVDRTTYVVGKSGYRNNSRSGIGDNRTYPITHSPAAAESFMESGIYFIDRASHGFTFVNCTTNGLELYQIVPLPAEFSNAPRQSSEAPTTTALPPAAAAISAASPAAAATDGDHTSVWERQVTGYNIGP